MEPLGPMTLDIRDLLWHGLGFVVLGFGFRRSHLDTPREVCGSRSDCSELKAGAGTPTHTHTHTHTNSCFSKLDNLLKGCARSPLLSFLAVHSAQLTMRC